MDIFLKPGRLTFTKDGDKVDLHLEARQRFPTSAVVIDRGFIVLPKEKHRYSSVEHAETETVESILAELGGKVILKVKPSKMRTIACTAKCGGTVTMSINGRTKDAGSNTYVTEEITHECYTLKLTEPITSSAVLPGDRVTWFQAEEIDGRVEDTQQ